MRGLLNRRDFLKLAGLLSGSVALPHELMHLPASKPSQDGKKNILIVVFDAFSAHNISLYGYGRKTTPNLERLAQRAIVYHNHLASGNFTTPGTASLLTGVYPWTHRAIQLNGTVSDSFETRNIFQAFDDYYRVAYTHNPLVNTLFLQFQKGMDDYIPIERMLLTSDGLIQKLFGNDSDIASVSWIRTIKEEQNGGYSYSLFMPKLYTKFQGSKIVNLQDSFPLGLPYIRGDNYFILEQAIDDLVDQLNNSPRPLLGYFHLIPPHYPYNTRNDFFNHFNNDQFQPPKKPKHLFGGRRRTPEFLSKMRKQYDEYILYVDQEFARLFSLLEDSKFLENTWIILTSDHGELFERAFWAHSAPVLYQPVIRVPLMIFEPGRNTRQDIHTPTSAVDLLPTLLHITGGRQVDWTEGNVLPPFLNPEPATVRSIYALEAKDNHPQAPLTKATATLVKGRYKLMYFFGYPELQGSERVELYDIEADPEELNDLYSKQSGLATSLLDELKTKLAETNRAYQ